MRQHNAENERVKRDYLIYLKAAKGLSEASLDTVAKAIHRFEVSTKFRPFRKFHIEQAVAFRRQLSETESTETGRPLSKATVLQTLNALRAFLRGVIGPILGPSATSSGTPSGWQASCTSTLTRSAKPSRNSESACAARRKS